MNNRRREKKPIAIIGAMDVETNILEATMENRAVSRFGRYRLIEGVLHGLPVVLGRSFVGMTNSATVATIIITQYNPLFIISEGTAGGHNPELHKGDIVVGQAIRNIHFISTQKRACNEGSDPSSWLFNGPEMVFDNNSIKERNILYCNPFLVETALSTPSAKGKVFKGTIGSGDVWNREFDRIAMLHERLGTDCEDMESFAIAQVCHQLNTASLHVRIISNSEIHQNEKYDRTIGEQCQRFVINYLEANGKMLCQATHATRIPALT